MTRVHLALAITFLGGLFSAGACGRDVAAVGLNMRSPQGLLDDATAVKLTVIDADEVTCHSDGSISGSPNDVQSFDMERNCSSGAAWCKEITLDKDDSTKVFSVNATRNQSLIAAGCATATINQDPLVVDIKIQRYNAPKCCNDGILQAGEQCDTGNMAPTDCAGNSGEPACLGIYTDDVCECDCAAREILLSIDNASAPLLTSGSPNTKTELALAFSGTAGDDTANALRAVFTDSDAVWATAPDINLRMLRPNLYPYTTGSLAKQLRLPQCDSVDAVNGATATQHQPEIARISADRMAVVFASDEAQLTRYDIMLSAQQEWGCADDDPVQVNHQRLDSCENPDVARSTEGNALVVWGDQGQLRGRIWNVDGTLTPADGDLQIWSIESGRRPRVAGSPAGWKVAYSAQGNIFLRTVAIDGMVGSEVLVNSGTDGTYDQPDIAVLPDGRSVVVWRSGEAIYFQRYDATGVAIEGDQLEALTMNSPAASYPVVTDSAGSATDFYIVAWQAVDGTIWGRFVRGDSGFGYNSVTGQNDDFVASHPAIGGARSRPAVAVGGDGFVAIGWEDQREEGSGVYVRRFPLPE